ncbi:hypothetical protein [Bacillus subtilis]|uniref:hypothetical protein n=1 Tax=Bacillus subtilis TaxID=1423 RepID=UPI0025CA6F85|nr:hypothetical protein [Bacillus subtilis]GLI90466.1 hypothetical protein ANABIO4_38180 [Bacillus subtilis]
MYGLRTAKDARDAKLREWAVSDGLKDLIHEVNSKVEQAIVKNQSRFTITTPASNYKKDTPETDGDITEVVRILSAYGYTVHVGQSLSDDKDELFYHINVSF